jgi:hypothetical protein
MLHNIMSDRPKTMKNSKARNAFLLGVSGSSLIFNLSPTNIQRSKGNRH